MRTASFMLLTALATAALAQEPRGVPRLLVDRELRERPIQLTSLDSRTVSYTDAGGLARSEAVTEYVAIIPPLQVRERPSGRRPKDPELVPARAWTTLELTDGQRFFGDVSATAPAKDSIRWSHPTLGAIEFKLDQLRRIRLDTPPEGNWTAPGAEAAPESDTVLLSNGDRLRGFVDGIRGEPRELTLSPVDKGAARAVKLEVVREVLFANAPQTAPSRSTMVWLSDGSVIACRAVKTSRLGELTLTPSLQDSEGSASEGADAKPAGILKLEDLLGAEFEPGSIVPLSISPAEQHPTGDRRWARPLTVADADRAVLGAGDIELPGPLTVEWVLPAGAARIAADAELPRQMWTWGECSIVLAAKDSSGKETVLTRQALSAEQPQARLSAEVAGAQRLVLRIEPGRYGGVQNRVILRRPVLLIEKREAPRASPPGATRPPPS